MNYQYPYYVMSYNSLVLWKKGRYQYEITRKGDLGCVVKEVSGSCDKAVNELKKIAANGTTLRFG